MKSIFNSLGSNYDLKFVLLALQQIFFANKRALTKLERLLEEMFQGKAYLFYKGRDAIEFTLRSFDIGKNDEVITQAFTCYAIEEAIKRTGAQPVYADLGDDQLNPSIKTLNEALKRSKNAKAVLIQHTLGHPAQILEIKKWCQKNNLLLIDDLAQSLGGVDEKGDSLGTQADAVVLSFGRDKVVDAVAGGAVVFKNQQALKKAEDTMSHLSTQVSKQLIIKEMLYPKITRLIRNTYDFGLGKLVHFLAKKLSLLKSPIISETKQYSAMPVAFASLALYQFKQLDSELKHRKHIAKIYEQNLKNIKAVKSLSDKSSIENGSNLRFAIKVKEPKNLITYLNKHKIYLADRWYRKAVDCGTLECDSLYQSGLCPNAEEMANTIVNLPTHQYINEDDANRIIDILNRKYLN